MSDQNPRIVVIGSIESTMHKLAHQLRKAGFPSVTVSDLSQPEFTAKNTPDIAIFLPKTPMGPRNQAALKLRKKNHFAKIVMLYDTNIAGTEIADAVINANCELDDLARVVFYLTGKTKRELAEEQ
jgi:AmiR/NasT family two-component response regulator